MTPPSQKARIYLCNVLGRTLPQLARISSELQADLLEVPPRSLLGALGHDQGVPSILVILSGSQQVSRDGYLEAFRMIRLIRTRKGMAEMPIVFLAYQGDYLLKLQCMSAGVTEFVAVPVRLAELRGTLQRLLGQASRPPASSAAFDTRAQELADAERRQKELERELAAMRGDLAKQHEAQEAIFEMSRQELLAANQQLKEKYEAEIMALKEKSRIEAMFGRYVSPEIVTRVLDSDQSRELDGLRRELTVLFADIRGFTSFCESQSPEKVIFVLNEFFTEATDIIHEHGGWVDKYTGDNIMALFGAPLELQEDARAAVTAARLVQERFRTLRKEWREIFGIELGLGIGVATGDVVVGNIGSFQKISYTAIGDTVNVASRLEGLCPHGTILVDGDCHARLGEEWADEHGVEPAEPIRVKGRREPVSVFHIRMGTGEAAPGPLERVDQV